MACPYFVPREILNDGSWPHPARLPLGAGWAGTCRASGCETSPPETHIRQFCNLGYAKGCPQLPANRDWDAIRFSLAQVGRDQLAVCFVCERDHAPVEHGKLKFDLASESWMNTHSDSRVATLAETYVRSYMARQKTAA